MAEVARYATNAMQTSSMDEPSSRPKSSEESKKGIWSSMLDNVASGKRLPEKSILVLGLSLPKCSELISRCTIVLIYMFDSQVEITTHSENS